MSIWDKWEREVQDLTSVNYRSTTASRSMLETWIHVSILCCNSPTLNYIPQDPKCRRGDAPNPCCAQSRYFQEKLSCTRPWVNRDILSVYSSLNAMRCWTHSANWSQGQSFYLEHRKGTGLWGYFPWTHDLFFLD